MNSQNMFGRTEERARALIIDDSEPIRKMLGLYLSRNHIDVSEAWSLAGGRRAIRLLKPNIILLDLSLEDGDGIDLLPEIAKESIPCIVISVRNEPLDRVLSLEKGAFDFVPKPIEMRELLLRVRRTLKAQGSLSPKADASSKVSIGKLTIDPVERMILSDHERTKIPITIVELKLLQVLTSCRGVAVSRRDLALGIGMASRERGRSLDILISRLRTKLRAAGDSALAIKSVRGVGYVFLETR